MFFAAPRIETTNFRGRRRPRRRSNGPSDSSLRSNLAGRGWNGTETANKRTVARNDTVFALAGWISCRRNLSRKLSTRGLITSVAIKSRALRRFSCDLLETDVVKIYIYIYAKMRIYFGFSILCDEN